MPQVRMDILTQEEMDTRFPIGTKVKYVPHYPVHVVDAAWRYLPEEGLYIRLSEEEWKALDSQ